MADFRTYSAAFHARNDDLMHHGVKGMKWRHHLRRLQEITGIGLKREEQQVRTGAMSAAKNEVANRQIANDPHLKKDQTISWHDKDKYARSGSYKDYFNYLADDYKADRKSATREANYIKSMYNSSLLGKGEKLVKKLLGVFKKR